MKHLDRVVAVAIFLFSAGYAWQAFNYELLPFERHQPFKPNTLPIALAIASMIVSLAVLLVPKRRDSVVMDESTVDPEEPAPEAPRYDRVRPLILVGLMVVYALTLRPLGFVASTAAFLVIGATVLGERKFYILLPVAIFSAGLIWYLVQEVLGIYMNPWPAAFGR